MKNFSKLSVLFLFLAISLFAFANKVSAVTSLSAIGSITGTMTVGSTLTAGAITPSAATVTYQWSSASSSGGTYTPITNAIAKTYTLTASEVNRYLKVAATGYGSYTGTKTSVATAIVTAATLTSVTISGTPAVGATLTAVTAPTGGTATYVWKSATSSSGTYSPITGATASTFTLTSTQNNKYIEVVATAGAGYTGGPVTSTPVGAVVASMALNLSLINATGVGTIVSNPAGINCESSTCASASYSYNYNTSVVLTATPKESGASLTVVNWTGCDSTLGYTCTVNMTATKNVTAKFVAMTGSLTPGGSTSCTIPLGASSCTVDLTRTINNPIGATTSITSATGTPSPSNGTTGTVTFTAPYNALGVLFELYNSAVSLASTRVTTNCASGTWNGSICVATYTVKPSVGSNVSISPNTNQTVTSGSTKSFTVTPDTGYTSTVTGTCGGTLSNNTYTTNTITADCTVIVSATINTNTLTIISSGNILSPDYTFSAATTPKTAQVNYGANATVTAEGWAGYTMALSGGCSASGAEGITTSCTISSMTSDKTVTVTYTVTQKLLTVTNTGTTTVTSSPAGISCGTTCTQNYNYGSSVTITAPAVAGYTVAISNGCTATSAVGAGASCSVIMNAPKTVAVTYTISQKLLTINNPQLQIITGTIIFGSTTIGTNIPICSVAICTINYDYGTAVNLYAPAYLGYASLVTVDSNSYGKNVNVIPTAQGIPMDQAHTYTIIYTKGTLTASNCIMAATETTCNTTLTWSTTNPVGTSAVTTAYPVADSLVQNANSNPGISYTIPKGNTTFYLYDHGNILAQATAVGLQAPAIPTLSAAPGTCGSGTINLSWPTVSGATCYIVYEAKNGATLVTNGGGITLAPDGVTNLFSHQWLTAGTSHSYYIQSCTQDTMSGFSPIVSATVPSATCYNVNPSAGTNVTISPLTTQVVNVNGKASFTVTPDTGYTASVSGTCGGTLSGNIYTTNVVTKDCTVIASATIKTFKVTASLSSDSTGFGTISPTLIQTVNYNGTATYTVTPSTNYYSAGSMGGTCGGGGLGGTQLPSENNYNYTTGPITSDCTVIFTLKHGALTSFPLSCVIPLDGSSCTVNLNWTLFNPQVQDPLTSTAITANGMANINIPTQLAFIAPQQSGTATSVSVPGGGRIFYLYNTGYLLAQTTVIPSCTSGSWNGSICVANYKLTINNPQAQIINGTNGTSCSSILCEPLVTIGTSVTLTPPLVAGYGFAWGGDCAGLTPVSDGVTIPSCTILMDAPHTVTASYISISVAASNSPDITPGGTVSFLYTANTSYDSTVCRLLDYLKRPFGFGDFSTTKPLTDVPVSATYPQTFGYYVQCRNKTVPVIMVTSSEVTAYSACASGTSWDAIAKKCVLPLGSLKGNNCTIKKAGDSSCTTSLTLGVTNPILGKETNVTIAGNNPVITNADINNVFPFTKNGIIVTGPSTTFYLNHNTNTFVPDGVINILASCDTDLGLYWDGSKCVAPEVTLESTTCTVLAGNDSCNDIGNNTPAKLDWSITNPLGKNEVRASYGISPIVSLTNNTEGKNVPFFVTMNKPKTLSLYSNGKPVGNDLTVTASCIVNSTTKTHWDTATSKCIVDPLLVTDIDFTKPKTIYLGNTLYLTWNVPFATSCSGTWTNSTGSGNWLPSGSANKSTDKGISVAPIINTTYILNCANETTSSTIKSSLIKVITTVTKEQ